MRSKTVLWFNVLPLPLAGLGRLFSFSSETVPTRDRSGLRISCVSNRSLALNLPMTNLVFDHPEEVGGNGYDVAALFADEILELVAQFRRNIHLQLRGALHAAASRLRNRSGLTSIGSMPWARSIFKAMSASTSRLPFS